MKHTPGPWKIYDINSSSAHIGTVSTRPNAGWGYKTICHFYEDVSDPYDPSEDLETFPNFKANAKLIVKAPDLLNILKEVVEPYTNFPPCVIQEVAPDWYYKAVKLIEEIEK